MGFIHKLFMCNWVGRFNIVFVLILVVGGWGRSTSANESAEEWDVIRWPEFSLTAQQKLEDDRKNGLSYLISGSLALAGGMWGASIADDDIEKAIYTIFQSIGVASVGYGAYLWQVGGEQRTIYSTLESSRFTDDQKSHFLKAYSRHKRRIRQRDRLIRAVTHSLIAGLNFYNAGEQKESTLRTGLYFIGGVNLLAAVSYTFEF